MNTLYIPEMNDITYEFKKNTLAGHKSEKLS